MKSVVVVSITDVWSTIPHIFGVWYILFGFLCLLLTTIRPKKIENFSESVCVTVQWRYKYYEIIMIFFVDQHSILIIRLFTFTFDRLFTFTFEIFQYVSKIRSMYLIDTLLFVKVVFWQIRVFWRYTKWNMSYQSYSLRVFFLHELKLLTSISVKDKYFETEFIRFHDQSSYTLVIFFRNIFITNPCHIWKLKRRKIERSWRYGRNSNSRIQEISDERTFILELYKLRSVSPTISVMTSLLTESWRRVWSS